MIRTWFSTATMKRICRWVYIIAENFCKLLSFSNTKSKKWAHTQSCKAPERAREVAHCHTAC